MATSLFCADHHIVDALPPTLHCDNQGAIKLAKNPVFHAWTEHIEVHHHFVRERVLEGEINLRYIHTDEQKTDILTKALACPKFTHHRHSIGIINLQDLSKVSQL